MIESYKKLEKEMLILCGIASIVNLTISETILYNDFLNSNSKLAPIQMTELNQIVNSELNGLKGNAKDMQANLVSIYTELEDLLDVNVEKKINSIGTLDLSNLT